MKDTQNEKFTELSPEQLDEVSGGTGSVPDTSYICTKCSEVFNSVDDLCHHLASCKADNIDPKPQPAPLPGPDDNTEQFGKTGDDSFTSYHWFS